MSRLGVTYDEVAEAAFAINQTGAVPTIDKIRAHLGGTGSNTTISKYLQQWRQQIFSTNNSSSKPPTPDLVKVAVDRVWDEIHEQTNQEIDAIKAETQQLLLAGEERVEKAEAEVTRLKQDLEQLQSTHLAILAEKELLILDLKKVREMHSLLDARYQDLTRSYADFKAMTIRHQEESTLSHQQALQQLEAAYQQQNDQQNKAIDLLAKQHESIRQEQMAREDYLKTEQKKSLGVIEKLQTQLEAKTVEIKDLAGEVHVHAAENVLLKN